MLHVSVMRGLVLSLLFFFQAEDGIRDLVRSRGLGDVYKRQPQATYTLSIRVHPFAYPGSPAQTVQMRVNGVALALSLIHI